MSNVTTARPSFGWILCDCNEALVLLRVNFAV
jgi:hypothetical protein